MLVKPAAGLRVRDPKNPARLVGVGENVDENDLDWHRLIRDHDLVECTPEEAAAAAGAPPPPAPGSEPKSAPAARRAADAGAPSGQVGEA